jgi:hypothetical protein
MAIEELVDESERREHPRYAVNIQIEVRTGNETVSGLMVDISIEGLRISIPKLIKPSTDLTVSFVAAGDVNILSRSIWALEKSTAGLPSYLVGLKIYSVLVDNRDLQGMAERTDFLQNLLNS